MIRSATPSDTPALKDLCTQLGYEEKAADIKQRLHYILNNPDNGFFVFEDQTGCVCGWAHCFGKHFLEGVYAELGGIVVDRSCRRQGIGKQLLETCERWATEHGYTELRVRSGGTREQAHQFYTQLGYENTKWQKVFNRRLT
ncbi:GNAT family N-acetyltransferase [Sporolactobacillus nakayamae]|uniref:N-acetylglutamate synthase, GNAT family n=1 Tax=Sporolactobacillus nakayamae TaxID=269670 RepID=A0A1I2VDY8_9BACL|nr:GNAT family N-acetyltransferase [Sporolactobacillus nakayamae]SFG86679.1 N-acetylglutamate synthase, GNAT family [Sporolactobacillus nakayamae]